VREWLAIASWYAYVACLVYLVVVSIIFVATAIAAAREHRLRAREARREDFDTLVESPFTIPVSIIVPTYNEEVCIGAGVLSLLTLDYPEYEVIVVDDGSTDGTLTRLREQFDLQATGAFYRDVLPATPIQHMYQSRRDTRLRVVRKTNGGKADALNCGVNLARYRYVCCVDADTVYQPDALLKAMRVIMSDPGRAIGVTSRVEVGRHPERLLGADPARTRLDRQLLVAFQAFDYLRAFIAVRSGWSRANYMLCATGAFQIWRRDVVLQLGGFSSAFTCEDIEFTFRAHEWFRAAGVDYHIYSLPDSIGMTEGPATVGALIRQRSRWQRVILETFWHYRRMFANPRYGTVGLLGMPHYLFAEVLAPLFQVLALAAIPMAVLAGVLQWDDFGRMVLVLAFGMAIFTTVAAMLHDQSERPFGRRDLIFLMAIAPLDLLLYRPILFYANVKGTLQFLRGHRHWDKFERNVR
jgi:cellulose synthase/poly-beta-1,6-N-acetylglucosamine synthase-like glycosyltransferase